MVVSTSFCRIRKNLVRLGDLNKFIVGVGLLTNVRVVFLGKSTKRLLDLVLRCGVRYVKDLVEIHLMLAGLVTSKITNIIFSDSLSIFFLRTAQKRHVAERLMQLDQH